MTDAAAPTPGLLLRDVRVAADADAPTVDVRVHGERVVEVGRDLAGAGEGVVEGRGRRLVPGLHDEHVHLTTWALERRRADRNAALAAAPSPVQAAAAVAATVAEDEAWVRGVGFRQSTWDVEPHKDVLERVMPGRPVVLSSQDVHSSWWSPAALAALGIDHPTGYLREHESWEAIARLPEPSREEVDAAVADALADAAARGVTSIVDYEFTGSLDAWRRRAAAGPLPLRVTAAVVRGQLDRAVAGGWRTGAEAAPRVTVGNLKLFTDGALGSRSAWCDHDYPGEPGNHGMPLAGPEELTALIARAAAAGIATSVHAIGDAANRAALDAFAAAGVGGRIEHAQLLDPADLPRFAALGVTASVQPAHATDDRDLAERWWADRLDRAYPLRTLAAAGARLAFGSDAPVAPLDPWRTIAAAVARTTDERPPWRPGEAVGLGDALAWSASGRRGVAAGDVADLVLLGEDPFRLRGAELAATPVDLTVVAGRVVHRR